MKNLDTRLTFTLGLALATASLAGAQDRVSSITGKLPQGDSRIEVGLAYAQSIVEVPPPSAEPRRSRTTRKTGP